jgi:hypothetical protein
MKYKAFSTFRRCIPEFASQRDSLWREPSSFGITLAIAKVSRRHNLAA